MKTQLISFMLALVIITLLIVMSSSILFGQEVEDKYDFLGPTCYVDSANGDDSNDGLTKSSPIKSQGAIPSNTVVVCFKRGSIFNEKLRTPFFSSVKVYTNYGEESDPLPHFIVPSDPGKGPVVLSWNSITIDGLHLSGARGDNTMVHDFTEDENGKIDGIVGGIGAFLGGATEFINNEVDDCDIGIMVAGENSLIRNNYVHDLIMGIDDEPGVDPNLVGGAEGIFINAANVEVCYNDFINCSGPANWTGQNGGYDGGATEISARATDDPDAHIYNVNVHHNYSYNNCGFFEVASFFDETGQNRKGTVRDCSFHNNVIVDSAWMGLLQVNNTNLSNIQFYNNTLIQHKGSINEGILWIIFTDTSSGFTGGELEKDTVFLTNNLFIFDGVYPMQNLIDENFNTENNIVRIYNSSSDNNYNDIGFSNIAGIEAEDFDLIKAQSPAIDTGAEISNNQLDYLNRNRPNGNGTDIGAFEYYDVTNN